MIVDLIHCSAADGLRLDGALHVPRGSGGDSKSAQNEAQRAAREPAPLDALLFLHGAAANFYGSRLSEEITPALVDLGMAVLWANTRGHDAMTTIASPGPRRRQGAAFEIVDECRLDVAAWVDWLVASGYSRIGLVGHSLGAIKAVYAQAHAPHDAVKAVIALSPPRLSYSAFLDGVRSDEFRANVARAQEQVDSGDSDTLLEVRFPFPLFITAGGYLDKYGPAERYNILRLADRVTCPTLFCFGSIELASGGTPFAGLCEALDELPRHGHVRDIVVVPGADHFYNDKWAELAVEVATWIRRRFAKRGG